MNLGNELKVLKSDVARLRELAARVAEIGASPRNQECIRLWHRHDLCQGERPLLLTEIDGGLEMVLGEIKYGCQEKWAREQEAALLNRIMHFEVIGDDYPIESCVNVRWQMNLGNYGREGKVTAPETGGARGAYHIEPAITDIAAEIDKLRPRKYAVDRESTMAKVALLEEVFDGLLNVRLRGCPWWTMGITMDAIFLIGLEQLMLYMYDQPEALHKLMAFLRDDHLALVGWMERERLLTLNNEDDYVGSGSYGYTRRLPQSDYEPSAGVRAKDLWVLLESQESVGVGPEMYRDFIFQYENEIARHFGGVYYGCCEPLHSRWEVLKEMANLRRVSISPWCNEEFMAEALGDKYVYSRKPAPAQISTTVFDEAAIAQGLRQTMELTRKHKCTVEIVMKDVHTLSGEGDRLARWVSIARGVLADVYG